MGWRGGRQPISKAGEHIDVERQVPRVRRAVPAAACLGTAPSPESEVDVVAARDVRSVAVVLWPRGLRAAQVVAVVAGGHPRQACIRTVLVASVRVQSLAECVRTRRPEVVEDGAHLHAKGLRAVQRARAHEAGARRVRRAHCRAVRRIRIPGPVRKVDPCLRRRRHRRARGWEVRAEGADLGAEALRLCAWLSRWWWRWRWRSRSRWR